MAVAATPPPKRTVVSLRHAGERRCRRVHEHLVRMCRGKPNTAFSHAALNHKDAREKARCPRTTSKNKCGTNARLRGCAYACRNGAGGGSSPGTRGDIAAKSLWELSIDPKSGGLGKSRCFQYVRLALRRAQLVCRNIQQARSYEQSTLSLTRDWNMLSCCRRRRNAKLASI